MRLLLLTFAVSAAFCKNNSTDSERSSPSHRILMLAPLAMPSHTIAFVEIATVLANSGHQITIAGPRKFGRPNMREIVLPVKHLEVPNPFEAGRMATNTLLYEWSPRCLAALGTQEIQDLKKEKYDLIILMGVLSECFTSFIYEMQVPYVYTSPVTLLGTTGFWFAGNPIFWSMTPGFMTGAIPGETGLTFTEKFGILFMESMASLSISVVYWHMDKECRSQGLCAPDMPPMTELIRNNSLMIVNGIRTMEVVAQPIVPGVIYTGGIHLKEPKPLPKDLEDWASGSGDEGFIYFSMGSVVKPSEMPNEYLEALVTAFAALPHRILWKWDKESIANLSDNVRLGKWLPQQDILGHPNCKLFITHGGYHSTLEALYNGRPVLGVPLFSDQIMNMNDVVGRGIGLKMDWSNFTATSLIEKITFILNNPSIKKNALQQSAILRDQLISPEENINYWINYVITHKGAPHLKCPATYMSLYQLYNMDVWLVLLLIALMVIYIQYKLFKFCWRCCRGLRRDKKKAE